jgi:hypothetical protein
MAPAVRHHFTSKGVINGKEQLECNYCKKSWSGPNDTQLRIHLSDLETVLNKGKVITLCTRLPKQVGEEFGKYFKEARDKKADIDRTNKRRADSQDAEDFSDRIPKTSRQSTEVSCFLF